MRSPLSVNEKSQGHTLHAYTKANLSAEYRLNDQAKLFGRIDNLFDARYTETYYFQTPGQIFLCGHANLLLALLYSSQDQPMGAFCPLIWQLINGCLVCVRKKIFMLSAILHRCPNFPSSIRKRKISRHIGAI
ncbi:MAG: TonB-dependent receptor [Holosporaceae bacterium]|nr:MAG: TonB-dependent receptor [Holosporaceae bacterium]